MRDRRELERRLRLQPQDLLSPGDVARRLGWKNKKSLSNLSDAERPGFYRLADQTVLYRRDWVAVFAEARVAGQSPPADRMEFGEQEWPAVVTFTAPDRVRPITDAERDLAVAFWKARQNVERMEEARRDPSWARRRWREERMALHADEPFFFLTQQKAGVMEAALARVDDVMQAIEWPDTADISEDAEVRRGVQLAVAGAWKEMLCEMVLIIELVERTG